jgi:polar amino acid transport system substrate-binding protein
MKCGSRHRLLGLFFCTLSASASPAEPGSVERPIALNSYLQPPFVGAGSPGVAAAFVALLNQQLPSELQHTLENVPRRRLTEAYLSRSDFRGVALFLSPNFIAPEINQRVHWSRPVLSDENVLVTRNMPAPKMWSDLRGRTLGGVLGHIYKPLTPLIERGDLRREDAADHISNVGRLCLGRVDFIVMSRSEYQSAELPGGCASSLTAVPMPDPDTFFRRVLVTGPEGYVASVMRAVDQVACGAAWQSESHARKLHTVACEPPARSP